MTNWVYALQGEKICISPSDFPAVQGEMQNIAG
jgi:hypothetical protein